MTIAFGVLVPGQGIVMATDSMRQDWSHPWPKIQLEGDKFNWCAGGRIAWIASGSFDAGWESNPGIPPTARVDLLAPILFAELCSAAGPHPRDGIVRTPHLLMGGGPVDQLPLLALMSADRPEVSGVRVAGCMSQWADERDLHGSAAPTSLDAAVDLAVESCRAFILESYRSWGIEGWQYVSAPGAPIPPMAFPLHIAVITPTSVVRQEVNE